MNTIQMDAKTETHSQALQSLLSKPTAPSYIPILPAPSEQIVTHFQPSNKAHNNSHMYEDFVTDEYCVDQESVRRKFGWGTISDSFNIPFLFRNNEKYCAVRMVEKYIFDNYLLKISDNIYCGCTNIHGYYVTVPEIVLLNEINEFHCDNYFGTMPFKQGDVLVRFDDANSFYEFLTVCSNKLFSTPCDVKRCGFLTINEKSMVPYVIINDKKCVPYFYFDGMDGIKFKMHTLKGWNLSYLKFCFKVHGIRDEFCTTDECRVIQLDELMQHLDPGDCFKETWPNLAHSNKAIFQPKKVNRHTLKAWHLHPITVLPVSTVKYSKGQPNRSNSFNVTTKPNMYYRTISHSQS